ncbi:MAG: hypothetical protein IKZ19_04180, partial [Clostridia bacterium]|nr:hypothetical protein [Clostridia bacterium]
MTQDSEKIKTENTQPENENEFEESSVDINDRYETEVPHVKKHHSTGCFPALCYCLFIIGLSIVLSAIATFAVNDVFALVKADVT